MTRKVPTHKDLDFSEKMHQVSRLGRNALVLKVHSLSHLYIFVALDVYILELYSTCLLL